MIDDTPLSILDTRPPTRRLSFNQKALVAVLLLLVVLPALLSALVILLMLLTGGPR
jgi:hypothetical protein